MRLASFVADGELHYGVVSGTQLIDAHATLGRSHPTLRDVLAADALGELERLTAGGAPVVPIAHVRFALPIPAPEKILCIGRNYTAYHEIRAEVRPAWPSVFARFTSSFAAHGEAILKPRVSDELDYEGELCVVIGRAARHVPAAHALEHVAGYTIMNEGSVRDWQKRGSQNCPGKNFFRSGSIGPWIVTADEIPNPIALEIITRVDGQERQRGNTRDMLFSIAEAIAHISTFTRLEPGDLIAMGSPGGSAIDDSRPRWLAPGQQLEIEIERIGMLRNPIEAE